MRKPTPGRSSASSSAGVVEAAEGLRCLIWLQTPAEAAAVAREWLHGGDSAEVVRDVNHGMDRLQQGELDLVIADGTAPGVIDLLLLTSGRVTSPARPWVVLSPQLPSTFGQKVLRRAGIVVAPLGETARDTVRRVGEALAELPPLEPGRVVSLVALLELLAVLRGSGTIEVTAGGQTGTIAVLGGRLVGALTADADGLEAADEVVSWTSPRISLQPRCPFGGRHLDEDLHAFVVRTLRRSSPIAPGELDETASDHPRRTTREEERIMVALESYLEEFKSVKGYIASGIMDFTGEALAVHSVNPGVKLEAVGAIFNDIFRGAHEASRKIGLEACSTLVMTTPKGIIVMECTGAGKTPHLHGIAILEEGGNQALAKMTLTRILPQAIKDLT